jgi:hypothetical protein
MMDIAVFDPGITTGLVLAEYTPTTLPRIIGKYEIPGGLSGAIQYIWSASLEGGFSRAVCEKFRMTPRVRTAVQVEPLRIEGAVEAIFGTGGVTWQYPDQMLLAGGHRSPGANKTAADNVLRDMGLWTLPSEVENHTDANDINSAMKHLVAYLRNNDHVPTLEALGVR